MRLSKTGLLLRALGRRPRRHLAPALAAAVAGCILTGAFLVGDSVRGTLRGLAQARLGRVDHVLLSDRPFSRELAGALASSESLRGRFEPPAAAIFLRGSASAPRPDGEGPRVGGVSVIGADEAVLERLTPRGRAPPERPALGRPGPRRALVNRRLAGDLGLRPGDPLVLSLETASHAPRESLAGSRADHLRSIRLEVADVIPDEGAGLFSLSLDQRTPRNVIVEREELERALGLAGRANALLVSAVASGAAASSGMGAEEARGPAGAAILDRALQQSARPEHIGLKLEAREDLGFLQAESDGFQIPAAAERGLEAAAAEIGARASGVLTYLANTIAIAGPDAARREIPYSTVAALDPAAAPPLGPLALAGGGEASSLKPGEILLGEWAANDLAAGAGDTVELEYYVVRAGGELGVDRARFTVRGIVAASGLALDPRLTPEFPGVTDAARLGDWDPPFPVDLKRIREVDEDYWDLHRATPKAFIALEDGRRLWGNRFGSITAFRLAPPPGKTAAESAGLFREALAKTLNLKSLGFSFRPIRAQALAAGSGTTDFGVLFLAFSAFLAAAAGLLLGLVWGLNVDGRRAEWGLLRAVGFSARSAGRLALAEGLLVCGVGLLPGLAAAPVYARFLLAGLFRSWQGSMRPPSLELHAHASSFALGYAVSMMVVALSTLAASRRLRRASPLELLRGGGAAGGRPAGPGSRPARRARRRIWPFAAGALLAAAAGLSLPPLLSRSLAQSAGPALFFGAGASLLAASIVLFSGLLSSGRRGQAARAGRRGLSALLWLGAVEARRRPGRSAATAAIMACAAFVVAVAGAARHGEDPSPESRDSGTGGFAFAAEADTPIFARLDDRKGLADLGVPDDALAMAGPFPEPRLEAVGLRLQPGDDASCLNLYRPERPRLLGAPDRFIDRGGFRFGATLAGGEGERGESERANPWQLLRRPRAAGEAIPAIADAATATWVLHLGLGDELEITDGQGRPARLKLVAVLEGSIFQGSLLLSEADLLSLFPQAAGYRYFLLGGPPAEIERMSRALAEALGPYGFDPVPTSRILAEFRAVEEAYLETFSLLGGLGLLLGSAGLGAVLLRGAMERRGELALLRALGFRRRDLGLMALCQNIVLVVLGLGTGTASALLAAAPHLAAGPGDLPWTRLAALLGGSAVVGLLGGVFAIRLVLRAPLIPALREER